MKVRITHQSGFTNPPEWYDSQFGKVFDVLEEMGRGTYRIDLPHDLYIKLGQFQYYVPTKFCEVVSE
jgi:hypothetical protein